MTRQQSHNGTHGQSNFHADNITHQPSHADATCTIIRGTLGQPLMHEGMSELADTSSINTPISVSQPLLDKGKGKAPIDFQNGPQSHVSSAQPNLVNVGAGPYVSQRRGPRIRVGLPPSPLGRPNPFSRENGPVVLPQPGFINSDSGLLSHGPFFPDPFEAGPSNWKRDPFEPGPSNWQHPGEESPTPPNSPAREEPLIPSPSPSLASSFPTNPDQSSGYMGDSSSADFQFHQGTVEQSSESEVVQVLNNQVIQSEDPSPMDYSPESVREDSVASLESGFSFEFPPSTGKGKSPMKFTLSRRGDKVWKWVKNICPLKRKEVGVNGGDVQRKGNSNKGCCSCILPIKKRRCSESDSFKGTPPGSPSARPVVFRDGPPKDK